MWGHSKKEAICKPERGPSPETASALDLGLASLQNCDKQISNYCLSVSLHGVLLQWFKLRQNYIPWRQSLLHREGKCKWHLVQFQYISSYLCPSMMKTHATILHSQKKKISRS
jgi:hypothetical protein